VGWQTGRCLMPASSIWTLKIMSRHLMDRLAKHTVFFWAVFAFLVLVAIVLFIIREAAPFIQEVGLWDFLFGSEWVPEPLDPADARFGILPMIVGSLAVTFGAMILAVPLGVACAILLAEVAPRRVRDLLRPAVELLVGIPSVVFGAIGMLVIVPWIRDTFGGPGYCIAAACLVLMAMVLPTIVSISEDAIRAVPKAYKEGSLALGATQWQTIWHVILPAARRGITTSVVLGMGRAVGETMAMIMVIGNAVQFPHSFFDPARTLTGNIALEISYATPLHEDALFATAVVLLVMIIALNGILTFVVRRGYRAETVA
jgi:phosphate transport system permease protein